MISPKLCNVPFSPLTFKYKTSKFIRFSSFCLYFFVLSYLLLQPIAASLVLLTCVSVVHLLQICLSRKHNLSLIAIFSLFTCCCCRPHSTNVLPAESSTRIMWQPTVSPPRLQGKAPLCRDSSRGPG